MQWILIGLFLKKSINILRCVNIGDFGETTNERFVDLVKALDKVEGIKRYRISSIEPDLLERYGKSASAIASFARAMP